MLWADVLLVAIDVRSPVQINVEPVRNEDHPGFMRLLAANSLPVDGLADHFGTALVARIGDRVVATAALEIYEDGALLRSVAVDETLRGSGLGQRIVSAALDLARERGIPSVYLLTTTAERFFPRFGFRSITRADVPPGVRTSIEFQSACPATAAVLVKSLE